MKLKHIPRDLVRAARFAVHKAKHNNTYDFHGVTIRLNDDFARYAGRLLVAGDYEAPEVELVDRHLPRDLPAIEFGGSLGVVSSLVRDRLPADQRLLVVEANARLLPQLSANIAAQTGGANAEVLHAAVHYDGPVVSFMNSDNIHANRVPSGAVDADMQEVRATTLADCLSKLDATRASLICDIEGAELDLFRNERDALGAIAFAIIETHPYRFEEVGSSKAEFDALVNAAGFKELKRIGDVVALGRP